MIKFMDLYETRVEKQLVFKGKKVQYASWTGFKVKVTVVEVAAIGFNAASVYENKSTWT